MCDETNKFVIKKKSKQQMIEIKLERSPTATCLYNQHQAHRGERMVDKTICQIFLCDPCFKVLAFPGSM